MMAVGHDHHNGLSPQRPSGNTVHISFTGTQSFRWNNASEYSITHFTGNIVVSGKNNSEYKHNVQILQYHYQCHECDTITIMTLILYSCLLHFIQQSDTRGRSNSLVDIHQIKGTFHEYKNHKAIVLACTFGYVSQTHHEITPIRKVQLIQPSLFLCTSALAFSSRQLQD
jgi:hypothetical protein